MTAHLMEMGDALYERPLNCSCLCVWLSKSCLVGVTKYVVVVGGERREERKDCKLHLYICDIQGTEVLRKVQNIIK